MAAVSSSSQERSAEIDRCLSLIAPSQSDESKFLGMLLLPRLLDQDKPEQLRRVFDGMNFKFIERLLRTASGSNSSDGQVPEPVLREIAINVLACFARYNDMATSKNMSDRVPTLSTSLIPNDKSDATLEALHVLLSVTASKEGLNRLLDPDVLKNVYTIISESTNDKERDLASQVIVTTYYRASHLLHEKNVPSVSSALKFSLKTTLSFLMAVLDESRSMAKFESLDMLVRILPELPSEVVQKFKDENEQSVEKMLQYARSGLRQVLSNKIDENYRDRAMVVVSCLLRYFGSDWLFASLKKTKGKRKGKQQEPKVDYDTKFPELVVHLAAVETRVMIDDVHECRMKLHNQQAVQVDEEKDRRQETMVPVCYEILEAAMRYLSSQYEEHRESGMDAEVLMKIRKTLTDTMNVVMELLKFIQDTTSSDDDMENDMIAQASMRIVAVYLAEEGYEL
ncbi:Neurochondrin-domain-containing protein [Syncephalastrum racemosum]|uniref:Neurochondrin-domain-containing protein n=1 Tax=Syncephalastrum racemosum TaxID=13706 RepID=A0A1X2HPM7_SYNRA|nr:Neurochondrin-domain-containing protein [Syncephalastrum racemosum]